MNAEQKAEEILDYCCEYLENPIKEKNKKLWLEMLKEIKFMLETD